ncbi:MAG TPA: L-threonylcarbamoyladenylate synthase [Longimicrobiales bacterium]|nr:L-threonylcarbamoyladenylate synthase [Longimicrobiales bacterium]
MSAILPYETPEEREAAAARVKEHLEADGIVAYPTETVYGLGCALRDAALSSLAGFKGTRPFLVLVPDAAAVPGLEWTMAALRLAERFWPGPLTLALPAREGAFPPQVVGPQGTVAVRVSSHPAVADLLRAAGGPVTSTSANRPGEPPARTATDAARTAAAVDRLLVLDGGTLPPGVPSTIVRCAGGPVRILREGVIDREAIQAVVEVA